MNKLLELCREKVVIGAWTVLDDEVQNIQRCRRARELGLDFIYYDIGARHEKAQTALDNCQETGLGILAFDSRVSGLTMDHFWYLKDAVADYIQHPALYGTVLRDEPGVYDLPRLALLAKEYRKVAPDKLPVVNLLPSYANEEQFNYADFPTYIDRCASELGVPYVSYDHYPLYGNNGRTWVQEKYLSDFEVASDACRKYGLDLWYFIQTLAFNRILREPAEQDLRWQIYCALSYGARVIQLFTYGSPGDASGSTGSEIFETGLIDRQGEKTERYDATQRVLRELRGFDGAYVQYKHVGAMLNKMHFQPDPAGEEVELVFPTVTMKRRIKHNYLELEHPLERFDPIVSIRGDEPVLAGCFVKDSGEKAFTLVNALDPGLRRRNRAVVEFDRPVRLRVYDKGVPAIVETDGSFSFDLEYGQGIFVEIL